MTSASQSGSEVPPCETNPDLIIEGGMVITMVEDQDPILEGQVFVLFIFAVAAAEVSVGLALIVWAYRRTGSVDPANFNILK